LKKGAASRGVAKPMQPVRVKILDKEYLVRSEDSAEDVQKIADYVNGVAEEICENSEGLSERKVAILTAMHIAEEYFQALKTLEEKNGKAGKRIKDMIYDIDSAMG
jgi:cell division protein ZapA